MTEDGACITSALTRLPTPSVPSPQHRDEPQDPLFGSGNLSWTVADRLRPSAYRARPHTRKAWRVPGSRNRFRSSKSEAGKDNHRPPSPPQSRQGGPKGPLWIPSTPRGRTSAKPSSKAAGLRSPPAGAELPRPPRAFSAERPEHRHPASERSAPLRCDPRGGAEKTPPGADARHARPLRKAGRRVDPHA